MSGAAIELGICAALLALLFVIAGCTGLLKLFLMRITLLNSLFFSVFTTSVLLMGRMDELKDSYPFEVPFNSFVCILIGIAIFVVCQLLQKTNVGFWIFAVIMSPLWALIMSGVSYFLSDHNLIVFWVLLVVLTAINVYLHIRSKQYRFELAE